MLDERSRYARVPTIAVPQRDGSVRVLTAPRVAPRPPVRGSFEVRAGARVDLIAAAALGDSTLWWLLADANPWRDAMQLEQPGQTVELPRG